MSQKALPYIQFNGVEWTLTLLGEQVFLLQAKEDLEIEKLHAASNYLERLLRESLEDIVLAYDSLAIFTPLPYERLIGILTTAPERVERRASNDDVVMLPICYELGLDWDHLVDRTGLTKEEIIAIHLEGTYRSLFMGFTPGFIYADGLDARLACPRKDMPRTRVCAGSVGIGGSQTGIYSLDSPGGWNIIGQTPEKLFDHKEHPPSKIEVGTRFRFNRISEEAFRVWER